MSLETRSSMSTWMFWCRGSRMKPARSSSSDSAIAEALATTRTWPWMPPLKPAMSASIFSTVNSTVRACSSSTCPAGVGSVPRRPRTSTCRPRASSSWVMRLLMAEGSISSWAAASLMLPRSHTATSRRRVLRSRSLMMFPFWNPNASDTSFDVLFGILETLAHRKNTSLRRGDSPMSPLPPRAVIREVGLRDGLQSIQTVLPTAQKIAWIDQAHAAGLREIEVGSFVPARLLPQLADTAELLAHAKTLPGLFASVLVPHLKGAEAALAGDADLMLLPLSASHAHSLANLRKTPDEVVAELGRIRAARDASGRKALLDAGADRVSLADTVGYADPASVSRLFEQALRLAGERFWCGHFHDTRGLALANVYASLQLGVNRFDASLAGIGGCPHAPGASGNAASEDLAFLLEAGGVATGIDLPKLLALRAQVTGCLPGEATHGNLHRAGLPKTFHPASALPC